jgi:hypothetical protein
LLGPSPPGGDLPPLAVIGITITGSVFATALVFGVGVLLRRFHRKKKKKPEPFRQLEKMPLLKDYNSNLKSLISDKSIPKINEGWQYYLLKLTISEDVEILSVIGSGGQGTVQKGRWKNIFVAIKSLNHSAIGQEEANLFTQEIKVLR